MPFVEVWVDDPECEGHCDQSEKLKRRRDYAVSLLFDGQINAAIDALTKGGIPEGWKVSLELQAQFAAWSKGELDGFDGPNIVTANCSESTQ